MVLVNIVVTPVYDEYRCLICEWFRALLQESYNAIVHVDVFETQGFVAEPVIMIQNSANELTLETLMQAAQAGDAQAYARLLKEVTPRVHAMVRRQRQFLPAADIEDLVQDVLISLHAVRATYDPGRPFIPWLIAITRNRLADGARRYARQKAHEVNVDEYPVTFSEERANTDSELYRDPEALKQAIQALPPGQREAVEMLKLREMSLKEAAIASGTSIGALKVSVHRAMGALRKALSKE